MPAQTQEMPPRSGELPGADHGGVRSMAPQAYKRCTQCGEIKALDEFHRNRTHEDGRHSACKECRRAAQSEWRKENREYVLAWQRRNREANRKRLAEESRAWRQDNPELRREQLRRHNERHPDKAAARRKLTVAVHYGKITKPDRCDLCGEQLPKRDIHGHHEDYSRPFDVIWACDPCHKSMHAEEAA